MITINLCAIDAQLLHEWNVAFSGCENVNVTSDDIFSIKADAIVSPANSFGFMDGGFDWLLTQRFGLGVQTRLQREIEEYCSGELLVGQAMLVLTDNEHIKSVIAAPTMRVPMILGPNTVNPYLAMRAALLCAKAHGVRSMSVTGLGTGVGQVPPALCASQMRRAYDDVIVGSPFPQSWREAQLKHMSLYTTTTRDLQK